MTIGEPEKRCERKPEPRFAWRTHTNPNPGSVRVRIKVRKPPTALIITINYYVSSSLSFLINLLIFLGIVKL